MKISIIGTGYVGLTIGACLADKGISVLCMDIDEAKIENLKKGIIPIYEPGLETLVQKTYDNGTLSFTTSAKEAIQFATIVISAVGTPPKPDGSSDLTFIKEVLKAFGKHINSYKIYVNKSTVPVGTGDLCKQIIKEEIVKRGENIEFDVISNPEFLREGNAIYDIQFPDRIIIGSDSQKAKDLLTTLYKKLGEEDVDILYTDIKTAEIIKYASNAMLATKISFINEIANFCELAGGDVRAVAKGIGLDKRIGKSFLNAGVGYGGSCFPKDVAALIHTGKEHGYDFEIIQAVQNTNEKQKLSLLNKLKKQIGPLQNKHIAIWGLAFKPETDDMREAPSLKTIKDLQVEGAQIHAFDPVATKTAQSYIEPLNITYHTDMYEAAKDADALLILTEWNTFRTADLQKLKELMKTPLLLDGRNIYEHEAMQSLGFTYICVGQKHDEKTIRQLKTIKNAVFG